MTPLRHVTIHFTSRCNLRCRYCHTASGYASGEASLDEPLLENLLCPGALQSVSLAGGEPFTRREEMWWLIARLRHNGVARVAITTNGTLLEPQDVARCSEYGVRLQFSLDGDERVHDRIRGEGTYRRALDSLQECTRAGLRCDVLSTASKETVPGAFGLIDMLDAIGVGAITFLHFSPKGRGALHRHADFTREEWSDFVNLVSQVRASTKIFVQPGGLPREQFRNLDAGRRIGLCNWYKLDFAYVDVRTGDVYPCGLAYETPLRLGSIRRDRLDQVVKRHMERHLPHPPQCASCIDLEPCRGGARCVSYWAGQALTDRDPRCTKDGWIPICPFVSSLVAGGKAAATTAV